MWSQELPAAEIASSFPDVSRPAVSQHLRVLKDADLLVERREGTKRLYLANTSTVSEVRTFLKDYWTSGLDRLRDVAEAAQVAKDRGASEIEPPEPKGST